MEQQWCHDDGRRVHVLIVRRFEATRYTLGVGHDGPADATGGSWFVYYRDDEGGQWHCHCGPYPDMQQAVDWVDVIRVGAPVQGSRRNG